MSINLPAVIDAYFKGDRRGDAQAIAACFTANAVVVDEGNTYAGRDAIRQWMANASTLYTYTVEPFAMARDDGRIIITSHLAGTFPGSPVDLRYIFELTDGMISKLEIVP
ncbi:MAG: nuclear transport factor 2 family protein [Caulobacterales bacterium]|uniref:nuclear transport factor 2 family protein n=1 Tax=Glycocaulis sp. TaxID=1969725 RepID=UPI003FA1465A